MARVNSEIENAIQNLEDFIDNARHAKLSPGKIVVNKDDIEYLISELRNTIPSEVERYRKIISNKEAIEREAQEKADAMLDDVANKTNQLLSENEIMLRANEQADEIVNQAILKAQEIVNQAQAESFNYKNQAQQYLNDMLVNLHELIYDCIDTTAKNTNKFLDSLNQVGVTVSNNLDELNGTNEEPVIEEPVNNIEEDNSEE